MLKTLIAAQHREKTSDLSCQTHQALHSYLLPFSHFTLQPHSCSSAVSYLHAFVHLGPLPGALSLSNLQAPAFFLLANLCFSFKTQLRHDLQETQPEPPAAARLCSNIPRLSSVITLALCGGDYPQNVTSWDASNVLYISL